MRTLLLEEKRHTCILWYYMEKLSADKDNINVDYIIDTHDIVYMDSSNFP